MGDCLNKLGALGVLAVLISALAKIGLFSDFARH